MQKSKYSAQAITEMEEAKQKETRSTGFALMGTRDSGRARLSNGVIVRWHTETPPGYTVVSDKHGEMEITENTVPPGTFLINGVLFDADELRKWLRWA